jgi:hypothetical protein
MGRHSDGRKARGEYRLYCPEPSGCRRKRPHRVSGEVDDRRRQKCRMGTERVEGSEKGEEIAGRE